MYIAPNGNIWLLHDVPLDNTYQHTIYWTINATGKNNQREWFTGPDSDYVKRIYNNQSYTRLNRGVIRVNELADNIYDCNYMAYQNASFGNKVFYAFITSIEYINNAVSEIHFEIDVIQTWYFDYLLRPCFLERTHTRTDVAGENIVPEPVEVVEYVYRKLYRDAVTSELAIIVGTVTVDGAASEGKMYSKVYGGTTLKAYNISDITSINTDLSAYVQQPDAIVSMYMIPKCLIETTIPEGGLVLTTSDIKTGIWYPDLAIPEFPVGSTFHGGWIPNNKKLYTYPYSMLEVFNPDGGNLKLRYEFFTNRTATLALGGSINQPVELDIIPSNYKVPNTETDEDVLINESLALTNYPLCSWNMDTYKAWVAQNSIPMMLKAGAHAISNSLAVGATILTGSPFTLPALVGNATSLVNDVSTNLTQIYKASIASDQLHGQIHGNSAVAINAQGFYFGVLVVNESTARSIDAFFDEFGYAIRQIQEPRRKNRRFFTYVKTVGCSLAINTAMGGGIPADDANKICQLHDKGITYWDASETSLIGDYALASTNTPIGD